MSFKFARRATLVGETTAGTYSTIRHIDFDNGMILNIAAVHHTFPNGSQFEGVGITPDILVEITYSKKVNWRNISLMPIELPWADRLIASSAG